MARLFGVTGHSGAGKTTLLVRLLPILVGRGLTVSTIKQAHAGFDIDVPGKDSYRHREAGAGEVMVVSPRRWALMHEHRDQPEPGMAELVDRLAPADIVLVEGFRAWPHPKLEVHRPALGKPLLCAADPTIVAVASDRPLPDLALPCLALDDAEAAATFLLARLGL